MTDRFVHPPHPPYYAVIFSSCLKQSHEGYEKMGEVIVELALGQPGCLGMESTRDPTGFGITISYWKDEASIAAWKQNTQHLLAQKMGIERWYDHYELRVAKVERAYSGPEGRR